MARSYAPGAANIDNCISPHADITHLLDKNQQAILKTFSYKFACQNTQSRMVVNLFRIAILRAYGKAYFVSSTFLLNGATLWELILRF